MSDQFVSMDVVLANGDLKTIDADSDLFWAMQGAGHNYGIVTSVTSKVYDIEHRDWAIETLVFSGEKIEEVYEAANTHLVKGGEQDLDVVNWSYWLNDPDLDHEKVRTLNPVLCELQPNNLACHRVLYHPRRGQKRRRETHKTLP